MVPPAFGMFCSPLELRRTRRNAKISRQASIPMRYSMIEAYDPSATTSADIGRPVAMTDSKTTVLNDWMALYRRAGEVNDPSEIGALFTDDAVYYNEPFTEPSRGRDAIVAMWNERKDTPGGNTFAWKPVVVTDEVAIVAGETDYGSVRFSNLWVIRFAADGRATEFTEWWMDQSKPSAEL